MPLDPLTGSLTGIYAWILAATASLPAINGSRLLSGSAHNHAARGTRAGPALPPPGASCITARPVTLPRRHEIRTDTISATAKEGSPGDPMSRAGQILSIALIAIVLVAAGATVHIILSPAVGEKFTEFYILGPGGKAAGYPTEFMSRTPQTVIIGIGNREQQDITYTVETFAVRARLDDATDQVVIDSAALLDRFSVTVPHDQTVEQPYTFRIMDPEINRLEFLLFKEAPPDDRSDHIAASYRDLHIWLQVH